MNKREISICEGAQGQIQIAECKMEIVLHEMESDKLKYSWLQIHDIGG